MQDLPLTLTLEDFEGIPTSEEVDAIQEIQCLVALSFGNLGLASPRTSIWSHEHLWFDNDRLTIHVPRAMLRKPWHVSAFADEISIEVLARRTRRLPFLPVINDLVTVALFLSVGVGILSGAMRIQDAYVACIVGIMGIILIGIPIVSSTVFMASMAKAKAFAAANRSATVAIGAV